MVAGGIFDGKTYLIRQLPKCLLEPLVPLGVSWVSPGCVLGVSWVSLGCFLGASWVLLGVLGAPGCLLGAPWVLLGAPGWILDLPIKSSSPNQISFEKILLGVSWWGHIKLVFENMCLLI